jgi:manganese transport protein
MLVWVVVMANLMAMLVQYLSAKAGLASGRNLPELCRENFPRAANIGLWIQAEIVAIATDLAEFVGAAIGLNLLFGIDLFGAGLITAVVAFAILALEQRGYRRFELAIAGLLGLVALGFLYDFVAVGHHSAAGIAGGLVPHLDGSRSLLLAMGIIGATVMPHVVYLHSALMQRRVEASDDDERRELLRYVRLDCGLGLGTAGVINLAMLCVAVAIFNRTGHTNVDSIEAAHHGLSTLVGGGAALAFAIALLASGLSSSSVGTYAGQIVMQGFIRRRIPLFVRRLVTMTPALVVLALGLPTTETLVISQVVLSFGIPFALVPLVLVTRRRDLMGSLVNHRATTIAASVIAAMIISLNVFLLYDTLVG